MEDLDAANVLSDDISADRIISGRQELARLEAALDDLPARCRETFVLRKIDGLSQRETAEKMGVSEATVEKQMVKAMRILTERFWKAASDRNSVGMGKGVVVRVDLGGRSKIKTKKKQKKT